MGANARERQLSVSDWGLGSTASQRLLALARPWLWLEGAVLLALCLALFALIQFATPALVGTDGYYHMKMGFLIREEGLKPVFDQLPLTILNEDAYSDHHLLYHAYLALFAGADPAADGGAGLTRAAKIASILLPSLAFLAVWWLLRAQRVPLAAFWTVALFAISEPFLYRMSMPRAQSASLLILVVALVFLLQQRYRWLLPLGFLYVWAYNAFPLLLLVAGVYAGVTLLLERRLVWQALFYPAAGIVLGLVVNPYFPENVVFLGGHLLPKVGDSATAVGNEWSPYRTWTLVENSALALAAITLGALVMGWHRERVNRQTLLAFLLAVFFGFMLFKSRRFVEYFPPFALIFLAFSTAPLLVKWPALARKWRVLAAVGAVLLLLYPLYVSVRDTQDLVERAKPADQYAAAALWLRAEAPPDTLVFQTDWDDFPRLFFYNSDVRYTVGLDPTFMEQHDPALFEEWVEITRGKVEAPGAAIRERFGAGYVFSDLNHDAFLEEAAADPLLTEVYRDEYAVVLRVAP